MPHQRISTATLEAKNVGPHKSLSGTWTDNGRTVVFAPNGSGKTFVSRMLRLAEQDDAHVKRSDQLLAMGADSGSFFFAADEQGRPSRMELRVNLQRGFAPAVSTNSPYVFRTFNVDYVQENLASSAYALNGNIEGYILGGQNIDLTMERVRLQQVVEQGSSLKKRLDGALADMRAQLKALGVRQNMREYKNLTLENLTRMDLPEAHAYELVAAQLQDLSAVDPDAYHPQVPAYDPDTRFLDEAQALLQTPVTRSNLENAFVSQLVAHQAFIADGVEQWHEDEGVCPFCKAPLGESAAELIHRYNEYLTNEESRAKQQTTKLQEACEAFLEAYRTWENATLRAVFELTEVCGLVPSLALEEIPEPPASNRLQSSLQQVEELLSQKSADVTQVLSAADRVEAVRAFCVEALQASSVLAELAARVAKRLGKMSDELRDTRKALCVEALSKLRIDNNDVIVQRAEKQRAYTELALEIRAKEAVSRTERRPLVAERMTELVTRFFGNKYVFDPATFSLLLAGEKMPNSPDQVLSEGEKTILAFCYFVASLPVCVSHAEDWDNLFLVVDDPIASLDSRYVDLVAYTLASLGQQLAEMSGRQVPVRLLVFTHNAEFINRLLAHDPGMVTMMFDRGKIRPA